MVFGLVIVLSWLIGLARGPLTIDIGNPDFLDRLYLAPAEGGFFQPEGQPVTADDNTSRDRTYRWTGSKAFINLPWPLDAAPLKLTLRATAPRPDRPPDKTGTRLNITGEMERDTYQIGSADIAGFYDGQDYTFRLPLYLGPSLEHFHLNFEAAETYSPGKGDTRKLAAIFFNLKVEPDYASFGWRGWLATLAKPLLLGFIALCCWGIGRQLLARRWALLVQLGAGVLLLLSLWLWPMDAEPYYAAWGLILPVGWLLLWLAGRFERRSPGLPRPFVYAATLFPLLPLAQFSFLRLNLYSINPASVTLAFFTGALLFSTGIYASGNIGGAGNIKGWITFENALVRSMLLASLVSFAYNHFFLFQNNLYRGADFTVNYGGLLNFEVGKPLYDLNQIVNQPGVAMRMPPTAVTLLWPLARIFGENQQAALLAWRVCNELLLIPILLILLRVFGQPKDSVKYAPAVIFLALNFGQVGETVAYGQYNIFILLGMALLALWVKEGRIGLAGGALSLPVGIKLYPVISGFYFLTERRWRGIAGLAGGGVILVILSSLVVGWQNVWMYATEVIWKVNKPQVDISNQSSFGFLARLAIPEVMDDYPGQFPFWVSTGGYLVAITATLLTLWVLWSRRSGKGADDLQQLKLGALLLLSLIIPPFVWIHYITPGIVALAALLPALNRPEISRRLLFLFGLCYALLAYGGRNDFFFTEAVGIARLGASYRFLAVVALWLVTLWLIWRNTRLQVKEA